jgi:hypothetical protein
VAAATVLALTGCASEGIPSVDIDQDKPFVLEGVEGLTEIAKLTGPDAINDTETAAVAGTDLGSMVNVGDTTHFFFGDTFGERDPDSYGGQGGIWRSNVSAYTTDSDPSDGITFDGWRPVDELGWAAALVEGEHDANTGNGEVTKIPTGGFSIGTTLYLQYMSVNFWGEPGAWDANFAGLARSDDQGATWTPLEQPRWPGDSNFIQITAAHVQEEGGEYIYLWCIPSGRFGGVQLMRVPATTDAVEDLAAYTYFSGVDDAGAPQWSEQLADAETIVEPTVGELSVMWSTYLDRWIMTYSDAGSAYIREGLTPWGPWGEPIELVSGTEYPGLYSPYLNPRYVSEDGRRIYFTLSLWGPYNVFWFSADLVAAAAGKD